MTFNEKLKQALSEDYDERMSRRTAEGDHKFSLSYRLWERGFLKDLRKGRCDRFWTLKKTRKIVTVTVLSAAVLLILTACAIVGITIGRYSFSDKKTYSELFLERLSSDKTRIEEHYGLPEEDGWEITEFGELTEDVLISYKRGDKAVTFEQSVIREKMGYVNTENAIVEPMSIYEKDDGFFIDFISGDSGLWWIYDGYLLSITGDLNKNELVKLALSTKNVDF